MRISDWSSDVCSSDRPHRFFRDICSYGKDRFPKQRLCRAGQVSDNSNNLKAGCGGSWRLFNDVGQKVAQAITLIISQLVDRVGKLHYAVNPALCPWIRCATLAAIRLPRGWGVVSDEIGKSTRLNSSH